MSIESLGIDETLAKAVHAALDITNASSVQASFIPKLLSDLDTGRDVLLQSATGSGKTLAFLLPLLHRLLCENRSPSEGSKSRRQQGTQILIIVPTRELAAQTQQVLDKILSKLHRRDHFIVSGSLTGGERRKSEKERLRKGLHLVVGTPGRLLDHLKNTQRWAAQVSHTCRWVVMDEVDRLLDLGFEKMMKDILDLVIGGRPAAARPQLILCSASLPKDLINFCGCPLREPNTVVVSQNGKVKGPNAGDPGVRNATDGKQVMMTESPNTLDQFFICSPTKMRFACLLGYMEECLEQKYTKIVIFSICCDTVDLLYSLLSDSNLKLGPSGLKPYKLHGNLEHRQRIETFNAFTKETGNAILICTDVAARGLNLTQVSVIIQYDAPCDTSDYIHRAGRTARQGELGKSVLFLMPSERDYITALQQRSLSISPIRWEPLVERLVNKIKLKTAKVTEPHSENSDDEQGASTGMLKLDVRKKIYAWQEELQETAKKDAAIYPMARKAFLSFVRAYATHAASEKAIFHIKRLHLGHLAASFLLGEAPKAVAARHSQPQQPSAKSSAANKHSNVHKSGNNFRKLTVSEFGAGDVQKSFMQPKRPRRK